MDECSICPSPRAPREGEPCPSCDRAMRAAGWIPISEVTELVKALQSKVARCCGANAGEGFCESYGCGTLTDLLAMLPASLSEAPTNG